MLADKMPEIHIPRPDTIRMLALQIVAQLCNDTAAKCGLFADGIADDID